MTVPHLVMLPGLGGTGALFAPLLSELRDALETTVLAYPAQAPLNYEQLAELVRERLPGSKPFVLLAESFSGPIAISIAAEPPRNLVGIVLSCTFAKFPDGVLRSLGRALPYMPLTRPQARLIAPLLMGRWRTPELTSTLSAALATVDAAVLRSRALAALTIDVMPKVSRLALPTLYLEADSDRIVPRAAGDALLQRNSRIIRITLPAPHFLLQCKPKAAADEILQFLTGLDA